jgi:hypothetical protein
MAETIAAGEAKRQADAEAEAEAAGQDTPAPVG